MTHSSTQIILKNAPIKDINLEWDQPTSTFEIKHIELPDLEDGQVLIKTLYISNDPAQRPWMQKGLDPKRSYVKPTVDGETVRSVTIVEILESKSGKFKVGDLAIGRLFWADYAIANENEIFTKIDQSLGVPIPYFISYVGITGLTAYFGLTEIFGLKVGGEAPVIAISAASGGVGCVAVQLAKHVFGSVKVIGISGTDEKCKWVESLGADICVNYTKPDFHEQLTKAVGDEGIDLYFDNVGGEILSFILTKINKYGKVAACGSISGYNDYEKIKVTNWGEVIAQRITLSGFIVSDYAAKFPEAIGTISQAIQTGKVQTSSGLHIEDISNEEDKIKLVPGIWKQLFSSAKPNGKLLTKFA
ncbi:quinone oxidoreductase [Scheffersomyces coipomensis]|uniref:quinone oxidoreductase n=1 Tax=Scheffersomyces coipomensis TaxID=1788519 RepID=UPI00315CADA8